MMKDNLSIDFLKVICYTETVKKVKYRIIKIGKDDYKMERLRGFEIAKGFEDKGINLPERKTRCSAAYDIESAEDVVIPSFKNGMKPTLVKTGLKAYMQEDEVLYLFAKSSGFGKKGIMLSNAVGVVDGDYYGNEDNDGHIMLSVINLKDEDITIKKGEAVGQAMFQKYLKIDDDSAVAERKGGFGSTSKL